MKVNSAGGFVPRALILALVVAWTVLGLWLVSRAALFSGTDEALDYLSFAAARNRWPTAQEAERHRITAAYYPPLYFLAFAPFWGDEPVFTRDYPDLSREDTFQVGGYAVRHPGYDEKKNAALTSLYRAAKYFSLALGVVVLLALGGAALLAFPPAERAWLGLLALSPVLGLPQFLYYHTLANNDTLCNALGALTILCFTGAYAALAGGESRRYLAWLVGMSFTVGLNLLTKTSAIIFLPLLPWGAAGVFLAAGSTAAPRRRRFFRVLSLLAAVAVAAGGWWVLRNAWLGDWDSQELHRRLRPEVFAGRPYWASRGWSDFLFATLRSYVGLMAGTYWGVSDTVLIAYAVPPLLTLAAGAAWLVRALRRGSAEGLRRRLRPSPRLWWAGGLLLIVVTNLAGYVVFNRDVRAPLGRILFPSLAASHLLLALVWWRVLEGRKRLLPAAALCFVVFYGACFIPVARTVMIPAVTQPAEDILPLAAPPSTILPGSILDREFRQSFLLPQGRVRSLRVRFDQWDQYPVLGGRILASLEILEGGRERSVAIRPVPLGALGWSDRYLELELVEPLALPGDTEALLTLRPQSPLFPRTTPLRFASCGAWNNIYVSDLVRDGVALPGENLCLTAVYGK